jgi:cellulose synthase operon protein YhjQ
MDRLVIAIVSFAGGTGRTTLTAELGRALALQGYSVGLVGLDSSNDLGFSLGEIEAPEAGLSTLSPHEIANGWQTAREDLGPLDYFPYGSDATRVGHSPMGMDRKDLEPQLDALLAQSTPHQFLLMDVERAPSSLFELALRKADVLLHLTIPSHLTLRQVRQVEQLMTPARKLESKTKVVHLLNRLNSRHQLSRDISTLLLADHGSAVIPDMIHFDIAVPESLAHGLCLERHAPRSQALVDIRGVANWLIRSTRQNVGGGR